MELPEEKVLERLNKVSTAKRQAYMVSGLRIYDSNGFDVHGLTGATRHEVRAKGAD
jgi:hypothetical protein